MNDLASLVQLSPEIILLLGACACLVAGLARHSRLGTIVSSIALATVAVALLAALRLGVPGNGRVVPGLWITSITYYARCVTLATGVLVVLVNWHQPVREEHGEYMGFILFSLLGVTLTSAANDLIVLFFAIELVSVPTYVLIALSRTDSRASEASVKYFFLGAMSAAILAYGVTLLYGAAGTTLLQAVQPGGLSVAAALTAGSITPTAILGTLLVFTGLCFKIAAVPLHVYVADVYEGAASPITGLLGFAPKMAGFLGLILLFAAANWRMPDPVYWAVWAVAAATMTAGNVLALLQGNVKRILAYSSIAHTGYMLVALLVGPAAGVGPLRDGTAAVLFYIAVYGIMNLGVFAGLSALRSSDRDVETLDDLAGLGARLPLTALGMAVCVFSLMGMPPMAGFLGKLYIFGAAFSVDPAYAFRTPLVVLAVIGVANTAVGAAYYLKIVATMYIRAEITEARPTGGAAARWGLALCTLPLIILFAWPGALAGPARKATVVLHQNPKGPGLTTTSHAAPFAVGDRDGSR